MLESYVEKLAQPFKAVLFQAQNIILYMQVTHNRKLFWATLIIRKKIYKSIMIFV